MIQETLHCPACDAFVDGSSPSRAGTVRCGKCRMRFGRPRREANPVMVMDSDGLGIHPALAKKLHARNRSESDIRTLEALASKHHGTIELSPSLVDEGAAVRDTTPAGGKQKETMMAGPQRKAKQAPSPSAGTSTKREPPQKGPVVPQDLPKISGYQYEKLVGKGAMGSVYRAKRLDDGQQVAIKILAAELAERDDFIARFERESAALRAVAHEGVVSVTDRGAVDDVHYFVMPYISGPSLRRIVTEGPVSPTRAIHFARQIAQALAAAHRRKVIHRDLKPENIIVSESQAGGLRLVLVDFGLAGMGEDDPHPNLTKSRMTMGTVNYMAPEQRTDAKRVGPQADLYALGVILYEMLTGDLPLGRFKLPTERTELRHLPKRIDECLSRALDRDPDKRYVTAGSFDKDLAYVEAELRRQSARDTVVGRSLPATEGLATDVESVPAFASTQVSTVGSQSSGTGQTVFSERKTVRNAVLAVVGLTLLCGAAALAFLWGPASEDAAQGPPVNGNEVFGPILKSFRTEYGTFAAHRAGWRGTQKRMAYTPEQGAAHSTLAVVSQPSGPGTETVTGMAAASASSGDALIGFARGDTIFAFGRDEGRCRYILAGRGGSIVDVTNLDCSPAAGPLAMRISCGETQDGVVCQGELDGTKMPPKAMKKMEGSDWSFFTGCRSDTPCEILSARSQ